MTDPIPARRPRVRACAFTSVMLSLLGHGQHQAAGFEGMESSRDRGDASTREVVCGVKARVETKGLATLGSGGLLTLELEGAPAIGQPFQLRVSRGEAGGRGLLFFSAVENPTVFPAYGATLYPRLPGIRRGFTLDTHGRSAPLLAWSPITPALCGLKLVAQAVTFDSAATGGIAFTRALVMTAGSGNCCEPFATPLIPIGDDPKCLDLVDMDGDGVLDLVLGVASGVAVHPGVGDGTFGPGVTYPTGGLALGLATGDLNGDTFPDVVTTLFLPYAVDVFLNNGDGTLSAYAEFDVVPGVLGVALADLNGDGAMDVVTAHSGWNSVAVLLGQGDGTLGPYTLWAAGAYPGPLRIHDLDLDGDADIVLVNILSSTPAFARTVTVLLGEGDGTFAPPNPYLTSTLPSDVAVGDFDGDTIPDLAVSSLYESVVAIHIGRGNGTFIPKRTYPARLSSQIEVTDWNGDAVLDLYMTGRPGSVLTLVGNGDGSFDAPSSFPLATEASAAALGDVDGDGVPDVLQIFEYLGNLAVLRGRTDVTFETGLELSVSVAETIALGDFDGDQLQDILVGEPRGAGLRLFLNQGGRSFGAGILSSAAGDSIDLAVGHLDADPWLDVAIADGDGNQVNVLLGQGDGTFSVTSGYAPGVYPQAIALADFDGDTFTDMAVAGSPDTVYLWTGSASGAFTAGAQVPVGRGPKFIASADLDGDGLADLVTCNQFSKDLSILRGNGDGTFTVLGSISAGSGLAVHVTIGDLNGDSVPDLATANGKSVGVFLGQGGGTFASPVEYPIVRNSASVTIGDFDRDLIPDLALASSYGAGTILLGNGDGTFAAARMFGGDGSFEESIAAGDLDGDQLTDLVFATGEARVLVFFNRLFD